jgi:nickel/cobalt transporter (NicO) family protein
MNWAPPLLLVGAVATVGVLHTIVPDHWVPIALIARQRGWSRGETARAALQAGTGHVVSTLLIALAVWTAGVVFAARFGHVVDLASSLALIGFGGWIAVSAWRELHPSHDDAQGHSHGHGHSHSHPHSHRDQRVDTEPDHDAPVYSPMPAIEDDPLYAPLRGETVVLSRHVHVHRHGQGPGHLHWHDHTPTTVHPMLAAFAAEPPLHAHRHKTTARTGLLLILGSSPMVEGIPAFFAAARFGIRLILPMAAVFALSTIATYVALCVYSSAGLQRLRLGAIERYGEVLSGAVIALVGVVFGLWPAF